MRLITLFFLLFTSVMAFSQPVRMESLRLNGELPVFCDRSELESHLRIDSVLTRDLYDNPMLSDSILYVGETLFDYYAPDNIYYKGDKECILGTVVFDDQIRSLYLGSFAITARTTVSEIQALFPDFCNEPQDITVFEDPRPYTYCRLETDREATALLVFFREGKVVMIHLWQAT